MAAVVRLNDTSSHGGHMSSASGQFNADNIQVCVNGDLHSCPIPFHGVTSVTATTSIAYSGGKKVLRVGDVAGCGAVINSGPPTVSINA